MRRQKNGRAACRLLSNHAYSRSRCFWFQNCVASVDLGIFQASLNFDDPTLKALLEALPEAPAAARRQCLQRCGLATDDDKHT